MIYKYEIACKEAGLSEEQTAEIRRFFDAEQKKLKRKKESKDKTQMGFFSVSDLQNEDGDDYDIPDLSVNTEEAAIHNYELSLLRSYMDELSADDREFLYACFDDVRNADQRLSDKLGITVNQVRYRRRKLIEKLRRRFAKGMR